MHTTQTMLTDDPDDQPTDDTPTETTPTARETPASGRDATLAPPDQRGGEDCCPWCLAAPETFEHYDTGRPRCGYCDASIPTDAAWFERGEKIVIGAKTNRHKP